MGNDIGGYRTFTNRPSAVCRSCIDVFTPGDGERNRVGQFFDEQVGCERSFLMQRPIEGRHHRLFDFRTAEAVARADDLARGRTVLLSCFRRPR